DDLDATRIAPPRPADERPTRRLVLTLDEGTVHDVGARAVLGRNPDADAGEEIVILRDASRSISKTHLRLDATGAELVVCDLGSTNGSALVLPDGGRVPLEPHRPTTLPPGAGLRLGERSLDVERQS
ncbi:MAG: FHA domain-containing protein, partial [Brachybacterium sp.]|nr:FHA domain-containing protein [Brachybacterium sp.]